MALYRKLLGESYNELASVLIRFHDLPDGEARGVLRITHGEGLVRRLMANLMRLPKPGECVPVHLRVEGGTEREVWIRRYGDQTLVTRQWEHGGLLVEAAGPYRIGFKLSVKEKGLRFDFVRAWMGVLPIPRPMALRVEADAKPVEHADSWWIDVCISAPILGQLARYEGEVTPQWTKP